MFFLFQGAVLGRVSNFRIPTKICMTKNMYISGVLDRVSGVECLWPWFMLNKNQSFRKKRRFAEIYYLHIPRLMHFPIQQLFLKPAPEGFTSLRHVCTIYHWQTWGGWEVHMVGQLRSWLVTRNEIRHWWQVIRKGTFSSIQTFSCYCYWGGFTSPDLHLASVRLSDWVTWVCFFLKVLHHLLDRKVIISKRHTLLPTTIFSVEHGHPFGDCVLIF